MSEWRPIETAPRDGTEVSLWLRSPVSLVPVVGAFKSKEYFAKEYGDPDYMEEGWYPSLGYPWDEAIPEYTIEPTHWMPLPEPPTTLSGDKILDSAQHQVREAETARRNLNRAIWHMTPEALSELRVWANGQNATLPNPQLLVWELLGIPIRPDPTAKEPIKLIFY